ncbi:ABC transporter ATP-binding protein [Candidatus Bathyarchaeota archaeon]|nr:MAG: ABC transporter ATP-binding protein [Candidatus Bathyarchaeota archaeon]
MPLLNIINVTKRFGGILAVDNVSLSVNEGEIVGLIGPNGAGKTTLLNLICGIYKPDSGKIEFNGKDITGLPPHKICKLGIGRTYQIPQPFPDMTAILNVAVSVLNRTDSANMSLGDALLEASYYLEFVGLLNKRDILARDLTLWELRKLELARALATSPKLLLIDEVMAGLNPAETLSAVRLIKRAQEEFHVTVLWIEHVMKVIMEAADRVIVLHYGKKIAEGKPDEVVKNERVVEAYLGGKYA